MPVPNLAPPGERDAKEMEAVRDTRPFTEVNGLRRHDLEPELWRRNALQIAGLSKERKDLVTRE